MSWSPALAYGLGWTERSSAVGFSSGLPDAMEAVHVIGAGTGGSSRLSFNLCFGVTFGTRYCHQKWASTGGPTACFPMVESSFPRNPILYKIRASRSNFFPWDGQPILVPSSQRWVRSQLTACFPTQLRAGSIDTLYIAPAGTQGCAGWGDKGLPSCSEDPLSISLLSMGAAHQIDP